MRIKLFSKNNGLPAAVIEGSRIETTDDFLRNQISKICSETIRPGRSVILENGFIGYQEIEISPTREEFLKETAYLFREMNYDVQIEEEKLNAMLALDFDGTLWDSVLECYWVSVKAFQALGWPLPDLPDFEKRFRRGRFFPATGKDFYTIIDWIDKNRQRDPLTITPDEEAALHRQSESDPKSLQFEKVFYQIRSSWSKSDFAGWAAVQQPYPGVLEQVRRLEKRFSKIVIATTKDIDSTRNLLATCGLTFDIIGKEQTTDKMKQIIYLSKNYKKAFDEILFVDDLLYQVKTVKSLGAKVALAGWGYSSDRQKEEAKQLGIPVLALDTFADCVTELCRFR